MGDADSRCWLYGLQMVDGQSHVLLVKLVHEPGAIESQDDQGDIDTPHPPGVPPRLTNDDDERFRINDGAIGTTDTL